MRKIVGMSLCVLALTGSVASAQSAPPRNLTLEFGAEGRVRLLAENVSVQEILAEWARQCSCFVVNGNHLPTTMLNVPLVFDGLPQDVVLRSLLKEAGGYVLTPRRAGTAGPSVYETIYVLPPGRAVPAAAFAPMFVPQAPVVTPGSPNDEIEPVRPIVTPLAVDPTAANAPPEPPRAPGVGVSVPAVQIVPITPATPSTPAPSAPRPGATVPPPVAP